MAKSHTENEGNELLEETQTHTHRERERERVREREKSENRPEGYTRDGCEREIAEENVTLCH